MPSWVMTLLASLGVGAWGQAWQAWVENSFGGASNRPPAARTVTFSPSLPLSSLPLVSPDPTYRSFETGHSHHLPCFPCHVTLPALPLPPLPSPLGWVWSGSGWVGVEWSGVTVLGGDRAHGAGDGSGTLTSSDPRIPSLPSLQSRYLKCGLG